MNANLNSLWLIPALPLLAAGILALTKQPHRRFAWIVAVGAMGVSFVLSMAAFFATLHPHAGEETLHAVRNIPWFQFGETSAAVPHSGWLMLGWVLDPLTACMLVMVTF